MFRRIKKTAALILAASVLTVSFGTAIPAEAEETVPDFSYIGPLGTLTADQTKQAAEIIYKGLANHDSPITVQISGADAASNHKAISNIFCEVGQNYDVGILTMANGVSYSYGGNQVNLMVDYFVDDSSYSSELAKANAWLDDITSCIDDNWSDCEKALYLHEYIATHMDYDYDNLGNSSDLIKQSAYGMYLRGQAVCDGYSALYSMLLNRVGVKSTKVCSDELNHAWNLVNVNGNWYHVDVTHDDNMNYSPGVVKHINFLKTNDEIYAASHQANDYEFLTESGVYDFVSERSLTGFWDGINSAIQPIVTNRTIDVKWAVLVQNSDKTSTLKICDFNYNDIYGEPEDNEIFTSEEAYRWSVIDEPGYTYNDMFQSLTIDQGTLFYNSGDEIYAYYKNNLVPIEGLTYSQKGSCNIYGMSLKDGKLSYFTGVEPGEKTTEVEVSLSNIRERLVSEYGSNLCKIRFISDGEVTFEQEIEPFTTVYEAYPKRDGYLFYGWYDNEDFTGEAYRVGKYFTGDADYYAKWAKDISVAEPEITVGDKINVDVYVSIGEELLKDDTARVSVAAGNTMCVCFVGDLRENDVTYTKIIDGESTECYKFSLELPLSQMNDSVTVYAASSYPSSGEDHVFKISDYVNVPVTDIKMLDPSASLGENIKLNLYAQIDDIMFWDSTAYINVAIDGEESAKLLLSDIKDNSAYVTYRDIDGESVKCYKFSYEFAASEIDSNVTIQAYYLGNEGEPHSYSVKGYLQSLEQAAAEEDAPEIIKRAAAVAEAAEDYGAIANYYFDGDDSSISDELLERIDKTVIEPYVEAGETFAPRLGRTDIPEADEKSVKYIGTTLVLKSNTTVRHYFKLNNGAAIDDFKAELDSSGMESDLQTNILMKTDEDGVFYVEVNGITAKELGKLFNVKLKSSDGSKEYYSIDYSPCCYAYSVAENEEADPGLVRLMKSMYNYYRLSAAYANN